MKRVVLTIVFILVSFSANAEIIWDKDTSIGEIISLSNGVDMKKDPEVLEALDRMFKRGIEKGNSKLVIEYELDKKIEEIEKKSLEQLASNLKINVNISLKIITIANSMYQN